MEEDYDGIYVGNESERVSGHITGENNHNNDYEDWTDLNGNTLVIVVHSDGSWREAGFELEFRCRDKFSLPICSQLVVLHNYEYHKRHSSLMCRFKNY